MSIKVILIIVLYVWLPEDLRPITITLTAGYHRDYQQRAAAPVHLLQRQVQQVRLHPPPPPGYMDRIRYKQPPK